MGDGGHRYLCHGLPVSFANAFAVLTVIGLLPLTKSQAWPIETSSAAESSPRLILARSLYSAIGFMQTDYHGWIYFARGEVSA